MNIQLQKCKTQFFQFDAYKQGTKITHSVTAVRVADAKMVGGCWIPCIDVHTGREVLLHADTQVREVVFADFRTE